MQSRNWLRPARMNIVKIIRIFLICHIKRTAKLRTHIFTPNTLFLGQTSARARANGRYTVTSITTTAGGINHENCKSALHITRPAPHACTTLRTLYKTHAPASHISIRDLCELRCVVHHARAFIIGKSIRQVTGRKRIVVYPLFQRHLQLAIRVCRCSCVRYQNTDITPTCLCISGLLHKRH